MKKLLFAAMLLLSAQSFAQTGQLVNPVSKIYTTNEFGRDSASVTILHGKTVKMPDLKGTAGQVLTKNTDGSIGLSTPAAGGGLTKAQVDSAARKNIADSLKKVFSSASIPYDHTYFDTLSTGALTIKPGAFSSSGVASVPIVQISNLTGTALTVTWTNTGAAAYQLIQATSADLQTNRSIIYTGTATTFNVTGLNASSNYFFGVLPVYASAVTTAANTVDNSAASPGYTVVDFFKIIDKTVIQVNGNNTIAGNVLYFENGVSITNGVATINGQPTTVGITNGFYAGHYKFTYYNSTVNNLIDLYNNNSSKGVQSGNNVVYEFDANGANNGLIGFYTNGGNIIFNEVKIEKQN